MIQSVTPKADPRVGRVREEELSPPGGQKPGTRASDRDDRSTSQQAADRAVVDQAAAKVNEMLVLGEPQLQIKVDDETERVVVKVVEQKSGEVIRQIPPEELLKLDKYLSSPKGLLLSEKA
ncbi:MAG: flagellar protein FlaG [Nitrospira sp. BO4]|jgi:flagellar protein FlaG|nr:flagellar protein FlaG [Nitrospira sp. BO4]